MTHNHWHIVFKTQSGYKSIDFVPFTSRQAAEQMIQQLNWAKYEKPQAVCFKAEFCRAHA